MAAQGQWTKLLEDVTLDNDTDGDDDLKGRLMAYFIEVCWALAGHQWQVSSYS